MLARALAGSQNGGERNTRYQLAPLDSAAETRTLASKKNNGPLRNQDRIPVASFQIGEEERAILGGAGPAHEAPAALAVELAR